MAATSRFESVLIARWALIMGVRGAKGEADTSFSGEDAHRSDKSRATYRSPTESATHGLELLDASQSGLPGDAFRRLVEQHGPSIYRVAYSIVKDTALAEDVTQETLLKVWQGLPGYRNEAPLQHWIVRIAHNVAVSAVRRRREDARDPQGDGVIADRVSSADTARDAEQGFVREAFNAALDQLDAASRTIVVLREIEGLSYQAIAEALDLPLPTVKTRLFRARRVLATELEGWLR